MSKKRIALFLALMLMAAPSALAQPYQDGVYRDLGPGYKDEVVVTVTVRGGEMTELTAETGAAGRKANTSSRPRRGFPKRFWKSSPSTGWTRWRARPAPATASSPP